MPETEMKIIHVISGLGVGGAEMALYKLLRSMNDSHVKSYVICLAAEDHVGKLIEGLGVAVDYLDLKRKPWNILTAFSRVISFAPDVIQTWMYHADLLGSLLAFFCRVKALVWNIRRTDVEEKIKPRTKIIARICSLLSKKTPSKIICCAQSAKDSHIRFGYNEEKIVVITNGFDGDKFRFSSQIRQEWRDSLSIDSQDIVIGSLGRWVPEKNYYNQLAAFSGIQKKYPHVVFLMGGRGVNEKNIQLTTECKRLGLSSSIRFLGEVSNPQEFYSSIDVLVLPSLTEGFPNVVGEAMCCEVPCVVTPAGDAPEIVGETGVVLDSYDAEEIQIGIEKMLNLNNIDRRRLGNLARQRVVEKYSVQAMAEKYESLYHEVIR